MAEILGLKPLTCSIPAASEGNALNWDPGAVTAVGALRERLTRCVLEQLYG